jgi:hypothetical protein
MNTINILNFKKLGDGRKTLPWGKVLGKNSTCKTSRALPVAVARVQEGRKDCEGILLLFLIHVQFKSS